MWCNVVNKEMMKQSNCPCLGCKDEKHCITHMLECSLKKDWEREICQHNIELQAQCDKYEKCIQEYILLVANIMTEIDWANVNRGQRMDGKRNY